LTTDTNLILESASDSFASLESTVTYRLLPDVVECVITSVDSLSLNLVGPATVVSDAARSSGNVTLGHGDRLSVVKSLDGCKDLSVTVEEVGKLRKQLASDLWCYWRRVSILEMC